MTQTDSQRRAELAEEVLYDKWFEPQHENSMFVSCVCAFCQDAETRLIDGSMCLHCLVPKDLCNYSGRHDRDNEPLLKLHCDMWNWSAPEDRGNRINLQVRDLPIWTYLYIRRRLQQMIQEGADHP